MNKNSNCVQKIKFNEVLITKKSSQPPIFFVKLQNCKRAKIGFHFEGHKWFRTLGEIIFLINYQYLVEIELESIRIKVWIRRLAVLGFLWFHCLLCCFVLTVSGLWWNTFQQQQLETSPPKRTSSKIKLLAPLGHCSTVRFIPLNQLPMGSNLGFNWVSNDQWD